MRSEGTFEGSLSTYYYVDINKYLNKSRDYYLRKSY